MAVGDLITTAWQWELNGLLMGANTVYEVRGFDMWAAPDVRGGETARAQQHGMYPGTDWLGGRLAKMNISITPVNEDADLLARQNLASAWQIPSSGVAQLVWREGSTKYALFGKPRLADTRGEFRLPTECRFIATDPRIYANAASSAVTGLATATGGLSFSAAAPFVFGTSGSGSTMSCTNAGTFDAPWTATFTGPLVAPALTQVSTGKVLNFSGASLAAGESLVIDSAARTVLLNGTASRYSWLSVASQWFNLSPGANSINLTGASGAGTVTINWRSAWI